MVEHVDGTLVERGEFERDDGRHEYVEVWQRIDPGDTGVVLTTAHTMVVRVGCHCLALRDRRRSGGEFDVRHAQIDNGRWSDIIVLGDGSELPRLPVEVPDEWTAASAVVLDGTEWRVAEQWARQHMHH